MSGKINPEDQDSNEPIKHSYYSDGVPTGREYQNLYTEVKDIHKDLSQLCGQFTALKEHMETQEVAVRTALELKEKQIADALAAREGTQRKHFAILGILVSVISIAVGVVMNATL